MTKKTSKKFPGVDSGAPPVGDGREEMPEVALYGCLPAKPGGAPGIPSPDRAFLEGVRKYLEAPPETDQAPTGVWRKLIVGLCQRIFQLELPGVHSEIKLLAKQLLDLLGEPKGDRGSNSVAVERPGRTIRGSMKGVLIYLEIDAPESTAHSEVTDAAVALLRCGATPNYKIRAYEALSDLEKDVRSGQILISLAPPMRPYERELEELGYKEGDAVRVECPLCRSGGYLVEMSTLVGEARVDSFMLRNGKLVGDDYPEGTQIDWDGEEPRHGQEWWCGVCEGHFRLPRLLPKEPALPPKE